MRGKIDPQDVVQDALLRAAKARDQFGGTTPGEWCEWLRQILVSTIANRHRDMRAVRRDVRLEVSLATAMGRSALQLELLASRYHLSASQAAMQAEALQAVAGALVALAESQREAITRHYLLGQTLAEVAQHLQCTALAVAGYVYRGLKALRTKLATDHTDPVGG